MLKLKLVAFFYLMVLFTRAQDSCYITKSFLARRTQIECSGVVSTLDVKTNVRFDRLSIVIESEIMGVERNSFFVITGVDSCKNLGNKYEFFYKAEESRQKDSKKEGTQTSIRLYKRDDKIILEIIGKQGGVECLTRFFLLDTAT